VAFYGSAGCASSAICTKYELVCKKNASPQMHGPQHRLKTSRVPDVM